VENPSNVEQPATEAPKIELSAELINGLVNSLLIQNFDKAVKTPDFHIELWELMCSPDLLIAAAAPRGHAKSTAVTHAYTLANILFRVADHILIISDTEAQAINFVGDIKNELLENEDLRAFFNVERFIKDKETEFILKFGDGALCRVIAKSSEQKLRGLKWRNKRPNLIVCDDLENDEIVMNQERREKFRNWFFGAVIPSGSSDCKIRVVGTILHLDSLLERLMPPLGAKDTIVEPLKQYSVDPSRPWKSVRWQAHDRDFHNILWPEQWPKERLVKMRNMYLEQGFPEGYAKEFLNYPIDEDTAYFKKEDMLPITEPNEALDYYIAADLAISEKDKSAFTVFTVAGYSPDNTLKVVKVSRFRGDSLDIIDELFTLDSRWSPEMIFIEQENIARTLGPILNKEMEERNHYLKIMPMTASQDKVKRARALQARMRAGKVEFDKDATWYPALEMELLQFPRGAYMDQVDSLAWIALGIDKLYDTPTTRERLDALYEEEYEDYEQSAYGSPYGANRYTGY
jgi:predicted phage terminase large subunit-like protein